MKRYFVLFIIGFLFLNQPFCFSGENRIIFTDGFRCVPWGTHKKDLPDLGLSKKALKGIYPSGESSVFFMEGKGNLEMTFQSIPLISIFLRFNNSVFYAVDMVFPENQHQKMKDFLTSELKSPGINKGDSLEWRFEKITIRLTDREILVAADL